MNWYFSGYVITTHKQSLGQSNAFTPVFHSVHEGSLSRRGLCSGGSLSRGGRGLCPEGRGSLSGGGGLSGRPPCTVKSGRYASYWNAFFFLKYVHTVVEASVKVRYATTPLKFITHISPYTIDIEIGKRLEN